MGASENENGAGGGEVTPRADARVYRMTLKQNGQSPYYNDSYALGLVGIGWWEWARPSVREKLPRGPLKDKLDRAISRGVQYGSPEHAAPTGSAKASEFPGDKVAILLSEDLTLEEADAFRKHWSEIATKDLGKEGAEEVALFLSAREGDIVVTRDAGVLRWGLFAKDPQDPKGQAKGELKSLSVGGHICRPVRWAGSDVEAAKWAEHAGFLNAEPVTKGRWNAIRVFQKGVLGGKDTIDGIIGLKTQSGAIYMGRSGSSRYSSQEYPLRDLLRRSKSIILEGVPGTGKTYAIGNDICEHWMGADGAQDLHGRGENHYATTLHPATSYEDFVEGLRPSAKQDSGASKRPGPSDQPKPVLISSEENRALCDKDDLIAHRYFHAKLDDIHNAKPGRFAVQDGFFLRVCAEAVNNPKNDYVVLLDEFNRCNVPKVMGDLLTTMERSKRAQWDEERRAWDLSRCQVVTLPASKRLFFVPDNVYVVATMNSTDRSVAPLDTALRRRFAFHRCWPMGFDPQDNLTDVGLKVEFVVNKSKMNVGVDEDARKVFGESVKAWVQINEILRVGGPDALLGHSYLMDLATDLRRESKKPDAALAVWVQHHWNHHILPQLADVLVTHTLESLVDTTAGKTAPILEVTVRERRIIRPPGMAASERGLHGALVLKLESVSAPSGNWAPSFVNFAPERDLCAIMFTTRKGPGNSTALRNRIITRFWERVAESDAKRPQSFRSAFGAKYSDEVISIIPDGPFVPARHRTDVQKMEDEAGKAYAWACYFKVEDLVWVRALVEELGKPATSK